MSSVSLLAAERRARGGGSSRILGCLGGVVVLLWFMTAEVQRNSDLSQNGYGNLMILIEPT